MSRTTDRGIAASRAALLYFVLNPIGILTLLAVLGVLGTITLDALRSAGAEPAEVFAAFFGITGTLLLATRSRWAGLGWIAFLASNAGWLWFSHSHGHHFMFWQQVAFTGTSLLGAWVWLVKRKGGDAI